MNATAVRTALHQSIARPELSIYYNAARLSFPRIAATATNSSSSSSSSVRRQRRPNPPSPTQNPRSLPSSSLRHFHTSPVALKKGNRRGDDSSNDTSSSGKGKGKGKKQQSTPSTSNSSSSSSSDGDNDGGSGSGGGPKHPTPNPEEPLDFADVHSRIRQQDAFFAETLKRQRSGGIFHADAIGSLRVTTDRRDAAGSTFALRELAQVIPPRTAGGRTISVLAHELAYVKPIMSAVQAHPDFNQQPQRDPDNELELILKVERPNGNDGPGGNDAASRRARATCNDWRDRVRAVRQRRDKLHNVWRKDKLLRPDAKKAVDAELDKIIKAKMKEIDAAEAEAVKLASGT
ncbi:ribosome recycling factor [Xylariomycetidae sp. FL2044]|nr:ribosome recycling factor [Xylariomycetidae sp. FL2044]